MANQDASIDSSGHRPVLRDLAGTAILAIFVTTIARLAPLAVAALAASCRFLRLIKSEGAVQFRRAWPEGEVMSIFTMHCERC